MPRPDVALPARTAAAPRFELGPSLGVVLLIALGTRLAVALLWAPPLTGDAVDYVRLAQGLVSGAGFVGPDGVPTSWRPPLYPAWIAPLLATEGWWGPATARTSVHVLQALLSTGTVFLTYRIASDVGGSRIGVLAAALQAVNVAHIAAVSRVLSETLFTALVVAAVALLVSATGRRSTDRLPAGLIPFAAAGALLGLAALTRGAALVLPGALVLTLMWSAGRLGISRTGAAARATVLCAAFALVLAPWTVRNARVHGAFVPVATQGGATLYAGNHPAGGRVLGIMAEDERTAHASTMPEVEASAYLTRATVDDWVRSPGETLRVGVLKVLYLFTPEDWELLPGSGRFNGSYAFTVLWLTVFPLSLLLGSGQGGVERGRMQHGVPARTDVLPSPEGGARNPATESGEESASSAWVLWPAWALCGAWVAIALVFYGSPRLRFPMEPMLSIGAAFGIARVVRARGRRTAGGVVTAVAAAAIAGLFVWDPVGATIKNVLGVVGVW